MYALRERRVHVTQEDFEMAVAKVTPHTSHHSRSYNVYSIPSLLPSSLLRFLPACLPQIMQKDSEKNMSIKKLWK